MPSKAKPRLHGGRSGAAIMLEIVFGAKDDRLRKQGEIEDLILELTNHEHDPGLNQAVLKYLSVTFQIPLKNFQIINGLEGKKKLIGIYGIDSDALQSKIDTLLK